MKALDMARNNVTILGVVAIFCLGSLFMLANPLSLTPRRHGGGVTHIVLLQYRDSAAAEAIAQTNRQMLALRRTCVDPDTKRPYILSLAGGRDNSIEGLQNGVSFAFVVEFDSLEKRDYYVNVDPAHKAFKLAAGPVLEKAIVVDFTDGLGLL